MKYFLWNRETPLGKHVAIFGETSDGRLLGIPANEDNVDYQDFLAWCAEGNEPEEWSAE